MAEAAAALRTQQWGGEHAFQVISDFSGSLVTQNKACRVGATTIVRHTAL